MSDDLNQINVKITCPDCYSKWQVSENFLNSYKNVSKKDLARQLCTCNSNVKIPSPLDQKSYSSRLIKVIKERKKEENKKLPYLWSSMTKNNIFVDNVEEKLPETTTLTKQGGIMCKVFSPYKYIPQWRLPFLYFGKFHEKVKEIEKSIDKSKLNKKYILLKHKCQKDLRDLPEWETKFNFISDYNVDHDNSYTILRALKERDSWYIDFLSERLISILDKRKEITLCRIPSSKKDNISGCDDLINVLASKSSLLTDGSKCLQRIESIPSAHQGGIRDFDQHIKTTKVFNLHLIENKDVLLIDDITTSGTSIDAFTQILINAKPNTLTAFVYGITIS